MPSSIGSIPETPWQAALRGARANLGPGLVLQAFALGLVLAYYGHAGSRQWLDQATVMRAHIGVFFPMLTTAIFGALIPCAYQWVLPATRHSQSWTKCAALTVFWAYKGFEIDLIYHLLAERFGHGNEVGTITIKAFIDQFIHGPIWAAPSMWVIYALVSANMNAGKVWHDLCTPGWYRRDVLPVLIANLGVWVPAVALIYALPTSLQLPMQNLVLCFFTLLISTVTSKPRAPAAPQG